MTVGQDKPLSRRQLRSLSRQDSELSRQDSEPHEQDAAAEEDPIDDALAGEASSAPRPAPVGGRRVRWDPASGRLPAAGDATAGDTTVSGPDTEPHAAAGSDPVGSESASSEPERSDPASSDSGRSEPERSEPVSSESGRSERRRSSFAPAFTSAAAHDDLPEAEEAESATAVDLAAPERTMTRRELRILRARAEAAGQPAPDVIFLPSGETTVTGAIPILDGEAFAADPAVTDDPAPRTTGGESDDDAAADDAPADDARDDGAPADDAPGDHPIEVVVIEEPGGDFPASVETSPAAVDPADPTDQASSDERTVPVQRVEPEIPALVEPDPDASSRFPGDVPAELPTEIVIEVEVDETALVDSSPSDSSPVDSGLVDAARVDSTSVSAAPADAAPADAVPADAGPADAVPEGTKPAPGSLRPFDALFLPPSMQAGAGADARTDGSADDAIIDTSSAGLPDDATGLRGAILTESAKPFGHWSTQADDDDSEPALRRDVSAGAGAVTTHALVLPSIPDSSEPLLSPLTSTGEIMVTGTIDLPRSYGSTGAHPALFDHSDVDALIDDVDREDGDTGVAPVRATRAVSSTTTTRSMIGAEPQKKSRLVPIIAISLGGAVFIAAVSWLVANVFFTQF